MRNRSDDRPPTIIDVMAAALAKADNAGPGADAERYRHLAVAALRAMLKPSDAMLDAAHEAVWFDGFWAIKGKADFRRAVKAMISAAIREQK